MSNSDKPALAIAYNTRRVAGKKKMAFGGKAEADNAPDTAILKESYKAPMKSAYMADKATDESPEDQELRGIVESIRAKKRAMMDSEEGMFAEGGKVAHGQTDDFEYPASLSPYDDDNALDGDTKELYDSDQLSAQPMQGDQHGDSDSDYSDEGPAKSLVDRIRERMRNRRGF